jgi:hypothetical protein
VTDGRRDTGAGDYLVVPDIRHLERQRYIVRLLGACPVVRRFKLINAEDAAHPRQEFDPAGPGACDWASLAGGSERRIRSTRLADADRAEILSDAAGPCDRCSAQPPGHRTATGRQRCPTTATQPGGQPRPATLDALMRVLPVAGEPPTDSGKKTSSCDDVERLKQRQRRSVAASPGARRHLAAHPRHPALTLGIAPER